MKRSILLGLVGIIATVSSVGYLQASSRDYDYRNKGIQICVKNSGVAFIIGEGFKNTDCKKKW